MSGTMQILILAFATLGGVGVYLLLPRGKQGRLALGLAPSLAALSLLWAIWARGFQEVEIPQEVAFYVLATVTVVGAVLTVTQRSPLHSALWFTSVVIGTAGLFLLEQASFLAAANVIVYAGAIIVMFLFVIMLAQQRGVAQHDRFAREPELATAGSFALLAILLTTIVATYHGDQPVLRPVPADAPGIAAWEEWDARPAAPHVAALGRVLFTEHWLSIELAGTLLLVAMVGAIVIAARRAPQPASGSATGLASGSATGLASGGRQPPDVS
jgi:NADH-quinone oxidoreductase subunit J